MTVPSYTASVGRFSPVSTTLFAPPTCSGEANSVWAASTPTGVRPVPQGTHSPPRKLAGLTFTVDR